MDNTKVVIIGVGHVGSHCASALMARGICSEVALIDIDTVKAQSQALDLADSAGYFPRHVKVKAGDYSDCRDADIVVVSVGSPPDFNRSRMEYLDETVDMVKTIIGPLNHSDFGGVLINISNPADVITQFIQEVTGFPAHRVISTSTMLDSARLKRILADKTGVELKHIHAFTMGEHGASQMVPWSNVTFSGRPLVQLVKEQPEKFGTLNINELKQYTIGAGYEVIRGKGSTEFGIGAAIAELIKVILNNERKVLPVSVLLEGQYGQRAVYASVPAVIGKNGVEEIVEIPLTDTEIAEFAASCNEIRKNFCLAKSR